MSNPERGQNILKLLAVGIIGGIIGASLMAVVMGGKGFLSSGPPYLEAPVPMVPDESAFTKAIEKAEPAVVSIEITYPAEPDGERPRQRRATAGRASGVIIDGKKGYVLTNAHVVRDAEEILVRLSDERKFPARLVGKDSVFDIALLQIDGTDLPTAVLGRSSDLPVGSWVVAIGNPLVFERSVTVGIISGKGRRVPSPEGDFDIPDLLQTDAAINLGNSGGALINLRGEVVGIPTAMVRLPRTEGLGFAVAIDRAKTAVDELLKHGRVRHPWLGILYRSIPPKSRLPGLPKDERGALLLEIAKGSPAFHAGLHEGDVIRQVNEQGISDREDLSAAVCDMRVGQRVSLGVWRDGREQKISLVVGEMPDPSEISKMFPSAEP